MDQEFKDKCMRYILERMHKGWYLHEKSWVPGTNPDNGDFGHYAKTEDQAMIEACESDEDEAYFIRLFGHWSNDIQDMAERKYGIKCQPVLKE